MWLVLVARWVFEVKYILKVTLRFASSVNYNLDQAYCNSYLTVTGPNQLNSAVTREAVLGSLVGPFISLQLCFHWIKYWMLFLCSVMNLISVREIEQK